MKTFILAGIFLLLSSKAHAVTIDVNKLIESIVSTITVTNNLPETKSALGDFEDPDVFYHKDYGIIVTVGMLKEVKTADELAFAIAESLAYVYDMGCFNKDFSFYKELDEANISIEYKMSQCYSIKAVEYVRRTGYNPNGALDLYGHLRDYHKGSYQYAHKYLFLREYFNHMNYPVSRLK